MPVLQRFAFRYSELFRAVTVIGILALCEIAFCGSRSWIADNMHHPRYIIFTVTALPLAVALLISIPLDKLLTKRLQKLLLLLSLIALFTAASVRHGTPIAHPQAILDQQFGQYSEAILQSGCPAMGATYWDLWTTYFHLKMIQHDRGGPVPFPVGWRSWEYRQAWHDAAVNGPFRVAVPKGISDELRVEAERRGLEPLVKVGELQGLEIGTTQPMKAP